MNRLNGRILTGNKRTKEERKSDFYPTPPKVTHSLLDMVLFKGNILEPACGKGHMSRVLETKYPVESYDREDRGYGHVKDFFLETRTFDNVVTNPPFRNAEEFIRKAKQIARYKIAFFLKLVFLEGQSRYSLFNEPSAFPLSRVLVFSERITLALDNELESGGTIAYAWFIWDSSHKGKPTIDWIKPR